MFETDCHGWAEETFGNCKLGDSRRTRRLVTYAALQAANPEATTNAACCGDIAAKEGAYRLLRNKAVRAEDIDEGVFEVAAECCDALEEFLVIQDTTTVAVASADLAAQLRENGSPSGFLVHTSLAVDPSTKVPIGPLAQQRWVRKKGRPGKASRGQRPYEEKESYKWEQAQRQVLRSVKDPSKMLVVCDREADVFEFLQFLCGTNTRFVVRASFDRLLVEGRHPKLRESVGASPVLGRHNVSVGQRGPIKKGRAKERRAGRPARTARVEVQSETVTLANPKNCTGSSETLIQVSAVWVHEPDPPNGVAALDWLLLTSEPVETYEQARKVIEIYELRWLIEEFHDVWKNGCRLQERPFQDLAYLEKLYTITVPVAVRLLQLRVLQHSQPKEPCTTVLDEDEWHCLHVTTEPKKPIPKKAPTVLWACHAIAKMAGWGDTGGTGRIGWKTFWKGWWMLEERLVGWRAAKALAQQEVTKM